MSKQKSQDVTVLVDASDLVRHVNEHAPNNIEGRPLYCISQAVLMRIAEERRFMPAYRYGDTRLWDMGARDKIRSALDTAMLASLASRGNQNTASAATA
jgi:hypothetical protein